MEQRPFDTIDLFENRLASSNLTHEQLRYLLVEPSEKLTERVDISQFPYDDLDHILNHGSFELDVTTRYVKHPLVQFVRPILHLGIERVRAYVSQFGEKEQAIFADTIVDDELLTMLIYRFLPMVEKVVVLEMHVLLIQTKCHRYLHWNHQAADLIL